MHGTKLVSLLLIVVTVALNAGAQLSLKQGTRAAEGARVLGIGVICLGVVLVSRS